MSDALASARELLRSYPLIDGHNDLPWEIREQFNSDIDAADLAARNLKTHTDLLRMRRGGVGGQFWSVYVPSALQGESAVATTLEQIDLVYRMIDAFPGELQLATTAEEVRIAFAQGRIACLLGAEGGHSISSSLGTLRMLHKLGVRYVTLTHNTNVPWADAATDKAVAGGLTAFGAEVVREMQRIGILVDLSHVSAGTARDVLRIAGAPVMFSHSCARALCDNPRNVPDDILSQLAANGGICMVAFVPSFVSRRCREWDLGAEAQARGRNLDWNDLAVRAMIREEYAKDHPRPRAALIEVADHIDHVRAVAGVEHVGIGADYDGTDSLPEGLEDVSSYPALIAELLNRGWSRDDCVGLIGGNVLRVLREAESWSLDHGRDA